jgi:hypothetical protein
MYHLLDFLNSHDGVVLWVLQSDTYTTCQDLRSDHLGSQLSRDLNGQHEHDTTSSIQLDIPTISTCATPPPRTIPYPRPMGQPTQPCQPTPSCPPTQPCSPPTPSISPSQPRSTGSPTHGREVNDAPRVYGFDLNSSWQVTTRRSMASPFLGPFVNRPSHKSWTSRAVIHYHYRWQLCYINKPTIIGSGSWLMVVSCI